MKKSKVTNNKQGSVFSTHSRDQGIKISNYKELPKTNRKLSRAHD